MSRFILFALFLFFISCTIHDISESGLIVPKTVKEDDSLPSFTLNDGTKLHLETFGTNSGNNVVIFLHGGPGNDYRALLKFEELKNSGYFVVLWDQRGAGLSERQSISKLTVNQYINDLNEIANHFSPSQPFNLVGHSWGGAFATHYVQLYPDRIKKLVLIEPMALNDIAAKDMKTAGINITDENVNRFLESTDYILPDSNAAGDYLMAITSIMENTDDFYSEKENKNLPFWRFGYSAYKGISEDIGALDGNYDYNFTDGLKENFKTKVLLLGGSHSKRIGYDFQKKYQEQYFFSCQTVLIENAGHYMIYFNTDTIIPIITNYLNEEK